LDGGRKSLHLGDVGAGLIETREGLIVIDVLGDVIWEIFEVLYGGRKRSVFTVMMSCSVGVLKSVCTKPTDCTVDSDAMPAGVAVLMVRTVPGKRLSTMAAWRVVSASSSFSKRSLSNLYISRS
jgi:hypothetical protein